MDGAEVQRCIDDAASRVKGGGGRARWMGAVDASVAATKRLRACEVMVVAVAVVVRFLMMVVVCGGVGGGSGLAFPPSLFLFHPSRFSPCAQKAGDSFSSHQPGILIWPPVATRPRR